MGLVSPYQMENLQLTHILYPMALTALLIFSWLFYHSIRSKAKTPPEPPRLPIIGHLHLLFGPDLLHVKLAKLAEKYGAVMHLQVGIRPMLVISDPKTAKECFTTNDRAFASRPRLSAGKILGYDFTLIPWAPYSSYWCELRRISNTKLFSTSRVTSLSYVRDDATCNLVRGILERSCDGVVEIREHLLCFLMDTVFQLLGLGLEKEEMKEFVKLVEKAFYYSGIPVLGDAFPWLSWFDLKGVKRGMTQIAKKIDSLTHLLLDERVKMVGSDGFLDGIMAEEKLIATLPTSTPEWKNSVIVSLVKTMIFATMDTTSITMEWTLSELLNNPEVLQKVQKEIDMKIGEERRIEDSDLEDLPYLQAIIKETLRLHPPGPLLVPHESIEDCVVNGFKIPRGTRLTVNAWKIHRDPKYWEDPLKFLPERFVKGNGSSSEVDLKGQHFQLIPFGAGRRACPGMSLALCILHLSIARLIHGFKWEIPPSIPHVDMTEGPGFSTPKAIPLEVFVIPRIPAKLYV